ncbi:MAG TPA: OB-fold domain-containing protein [Steroidobacteraceae bacterium]|jgi:hypothetical protein
MRQPRNHLPAITPENAFFWRAGAAGVLRFMRCQACGHYIHPPLPICPLCKCREVRDEPVSGKGSVLTFTINRQVWERGLEAPYVIAIVGIDEQSGLRLTTNIINCGSDAVFIGMRVRVLFDHREDVWLPLFEPDHDVA